MTTTRFQNKPDNMLALVQASSLTHLVAEEVERMILSGQAEPGSKLNEMAIADRLGVSRGPLREALRLLEESGLIRQEKNRGAFVRKIDLMEASDIYEVRTGLDAIAGRVLASRITAEQEVVLRAMITSMEEASNTNDVDAFHVLNLDFHDQIIEMTGNRTLLGTYRRLVKVLSLFRRRNLLEPQALPDFTDEHSAIVDALAAGNGEIASNLLYRHAEGGRQRMLKIHADFTVAA